eukprot:20169-Heterococcus_DN1.PRE.1
MDSPPPSDDEVDYVEVDSMPVFNHSAGTYRNFWIRPALNISFQALKNGVMGSEIDKLLALHVVHAVGLQLVRYQRPVDWNDLNGPTKEESMFLLFVQGKAQGATTGLGLSGIVNKSSMNKIAAESNGRVYCWGTWEGGKTWPIYMLLTPKPVQNRRPKRQASVITQPVPELDALPVCDLTKAQLERLVHGLKRQRQSLLDDIAIKDSIIERKDLADYTNIYDNERSLVSLGRHRYHDVSLYHIKQYYIMQPTFQFPDYVTLETLHERTVAFGRDTEEKMVTQKMLCEREDAYIIYFDKFVLEMLKDKPLITKCAVKSCLDDIKDVLASRVSFNLFEDGARLYKPVDGKDYPYRYTSKFDLDPRSPDIEQQRIDLEGIEEGELEKAVAFKQEHP